MEKCFTVARNLRVTTKVWESLPHYLEFLIQDIPMGPLPAVVTRKLRSQHFNSLELKEVLSRVDTF